MIGEEPAGIVGEGHPRVLAAYEAPAGTCLACLRLQSLIAGGERWPEYKPLPRFPAISRDLAIVIRQDVPAGEVEQAIRQDGGQLLSSVRLFDVYTGQQVAPGMKSMAFALVFRSEDRTLTDEEIDPSVQRILRGLNRRFGAGLRDQAV
jgi:phenylalanyl-tRNA synthetase beta chain